MTADSLRVGTQLTLFLVLHPTPYTLDLESYTLNPKPSNLNPQP